MNSSSPSSQTALIVKPQTLSKWPQVCAHQFRWDSSQEDKWLTWFRCSGPPLAWPDSMASLFFFSSPLSSPPLPSPLLWRGQFFI